MEILKTIGDVLAIIRDLLIIGVMIISLLLTWKIYGMVSTFSSAVDGGNLPFSTALISSGEGYSTIPVSIPYNVSITNDPKTDAEISSLLQGAITSYFQGDKNGSINSLNQLEDILRSNGETVLLIKVNKLKDSIEKDNQRDVMKYIQEIASYLSKKS